MRPRLFLLCIVCAVAAIVPGIAIAHGYGGGHGHWHGGHGHGHARVGVFIGVPLFAPYYRPPVYVYPPVAVAPASPPVYIEQSPQSTTPQPGTDNWWYYCRNPQGYYPYQRECPQGWERVAPQPPDVRSQP